MTGLNCRKRFPTSCPAFKRLSKVPWLSAEAADRPSEFIICLKHNSIYLRTDVCAKCYTDQREMWALAP